MKPSASVATMSRSSSQQDFTSSKRHFHWTKKVGSDEDDVHGLDGGNPNSTDRLHDNAAADKNKSSTDTTKEANNVPTSSSSSSLSSPLPRRKLQAIAVSRLRSVITALKYGRSGSSTIGLGTRVVGTLFGNRKGHVHFALQKDPASQPAFIIELATPISGLVREMSSGLVRIALECDKPDPNKRHNSNNSSSSQKLLEEPVWRTYCNGKRRGFAARRECGPKEWKVLKAVEMISMGAGVLPSSGDDNNSCGNINDNVSDHDSTGCNNKNNANDLEGEIMYMRAKFERIVGSRDCEAFYMMNPDSNGAPELSIYLLRV